MIARVVRRLENSIEILWSDEHRSVYEISYLRERCPCVVCKAQSLEAPPGAVPLPTSRSTPLKLLKAEGVGNYALQFTFSDGHDRGIYTFDYLRELCPCPSCAEDLGEGE